MRLALAIAALAACQGGQTSSNQSPADNGATARAGSGDPHGGSARAAAPIDAGAIDANVDELGSAGRGSAAEWQRGSVDACRAAAAQVPSLPLSQRTVALLQGCQPCGDWGPLLAWDIPTGTGGPSRASIERGMSACHAFCDGSAKQRFLEALDSARGQDTRKPWRVLGELCKASVSAATDNRFMTAVYFAIDRAARLVGDASLLAQIELPLPAVSVNGIGVELPTSAILVPEAGPSALTVDAAQLVLGTLPTAKLSLEGIQIAGDYPGKAVEARALAAELGKPERKGSPVALLAPRQLPATRIVDAVAAAGSHEVRLAVARLELRNWIIPATLPVGLTARPGRGGVRLTLDDTAVEAIKAAQAAPRPKVAAGPVTIAVDPTATAASLANLLGALYYLEVKSVVLAKAKP